jgi:hypothetical protein
MNGIPLADAPALRLAARRLTAVRVALASIAIAAALAAFLNARHPGTRTLVPLASRGDTIVVVDLSASISTDTYAQIGATLSTLAGSGGKLGLVLFSDQAYEAMPQGTPARDLLPLARLFVVPRQTRPGFVPAIPPNPWTASFSGGTKISAGLTLAHTLAVAAPGTPSRVVLVSDLSDDPGDLARLGSILLAYRRDHVPVRIVGLNPSDADLAFFRHALSPAPTVVSAPASSAAAPAAHTAFPWLLVVTALLACAALALHEGWAPRLEWSEA